MEQLSGLDAAFIHQDSYRTPMHISAVLLYDAGADGESSISRDNLIALCRQRLAKFPQIRRKLRRVPMGVDTPYWLEIPNPDWDRHITQSSLSPNQKGNWHALHQTLAQFHGAKMALDQPLWSIHLLHGLVGLPRVPEHCQALVLKFHHAGIDGISLAGIIAAIHQNSEDDDAGQRSHSPAPGRWELWGRANINSIGRQLKLAETVGNLIPGFARARQARREFGDLPPVLTTGSLFNRRVRPARHTGAALLDVASVISIKRAVRRVTVNDIALATVAGGLRRYLLAHNKLPRKSLASGVPINLRAPGEQQASGNRIATMIVGLATHVEDPVKRLRLIHRYAVAGKKQITALGTGTVMDISNSIAPGLLAEGIRTMAWASRMADAPVPFHTMVSNVPGPDQPLYLGKARLAVPMGLGPIRDNMGLFHIVSNSDTMMSLSFSACRRMLPDPEFYEACLEESFNDLAAAAGDMT
jgi:diacylglycerol O-acyltransferase